MLCQPDAEGKPQLVVGIIVDQLRTDYVEQLRNLFDEKGFRTLMHDGVYIRDVDYGTPRLDEATSAAVAVTGAWPAYTGVPASMVFDRQSNSLLPALATSGANITNNSFTPENLRLSTIADELAVSSEGTSTIYSIAADPQTAVILAGHAGNSALWINNTSGLWATSSYYGALPTQAVTANLRSAVKHKVDTIKWRPAAQTLKAIEQSPSASRKYHFNYKFSSNDRDAFRKVMLTPAGNREITDMAIELIRKLPPANNAEAPKMLNIAYTVAPYKYGPADTYAETMDAYLKLDSQIARVIDAVDRYCGRENAVIWLTSTGYYDAATVEDKKYRIPGGEFSTKRARSLLNSYLAARHGNGDYVAAFRNGAVYLDNKTLELLRLNPDEVAAEARNFLTLMSGVEKAFTKAELIAAASPETRGYALSYDPKSGGDIIIRLAPGWSAADDEGSLSPAKGNSNSRPSLRQTPVMAPAFIMAPELQPTQINTPVEATALAPTIAGILRIRAPNGAKSRPAF